MTVSMQHFVLTPNGELLRYSTIPLARSMYIDQTCIYTCPAHLIDRLSLDDMNHLYRKVMGEPGPYRSKEIGAEQLFPLLCMRAPPHNPFSKFARTQKTGKLLPSAEHDVLPKDPIQAVPAQDIRLHFSTPATFDTRSTKLPPQAYVLGRFLAQHCPKEGYTWDTVIMDVRRAHDENVLRTRQPPERIFRYYMDALADNALLTFADKTGRPCDRPRNKKKDRNAIVRHPLKKHKGFLV